MDDEGEDWEWNKGEEQEGEIGAVEWKEVNAKNKTKHQKELKVDVERLEKLMEEREHNLQEDYEKRKGVIEAVHTQKNKASEAMAARVQENRELHD